MLKEYFRTNPRVAGVVFILMSLGLGKFFIYDVMTAAQAHADNVSISIKAVPCSFALLIMGAILFITGPVGASLLMKAPGKRTLPPLGWVLVTIIVGASFGGYFWFKNYISSFGYQF